MNLAPTLEFLRELADNNNKPWFDANKKRYEAVRKQFLDVVGASIREVDKHIKLPGLEPKDCVFRIYRDVRFSKDKTPYKINMSFVINAQGKNAEIIDGTYVHIQPGKSFIAFGIYEPDSEMLKKVRQEIDFNLDRWKAVLDDPAFKKKFGTVQGNTLKTSPKGYDAANPAIQWLRHTQFLAMWNLTDEQVSGDRLPELIWEAFEAAKDFRQFLKDAIA